VRDKLPDKLRRVVESRMRAAYGAGSELEAKAALLALAGELDKTQLGAATSLREGLEETLTVLRLGVPPTLARTLRSTNAIESMIGICRNHARNVKHWRDGQMALRWCAAGMVDAGGQFRRVNGHLHLAKLAAELERVTAETVGADQHNETVQAAYKINGALPKFHRLRDNLAGQPFLLLLLLLLLLSLTVVFGFFLTVDCLTKRPVIALRPRCPPLDFDGMPYSFRRQHPATANVSGLRQRPRGLTRRAETRTLRGRPSPFATAARRRPRPRRSCRRSRRRAPDPAHREGKQ